MRKIDTSTLLNYLILLYAFSIPISLDLMRIFAPAIIIVWFMEGEMKRKWLMIIKEPIFKAVGFLLLVLSLSLLWTEPEHLRFGIKYITRFWYILPILAIFTSIKKAFIPRAITAFLAGMFVSVIISYLVYLQVIPFDKYEIEGASPLMHHTLFSIFLVFSSGIILHRLLIQHTWSKRFLYGFLFLLFGVDLFLNIGRAGQILFPFIIATVMLNYFKVTFRSIVMILALAIGAFSLAYTLNPTFKHKMEMTYHNLKHISYTTSLGARVGLNIIARDLFIQHPLMGTGAGDYLSEKKKIISQHYPNMAYVRFLVHFHNQYAEFAVIAGIFALLAYWLVWLRVLQVKVDNLQIRTIKYLVLVTFILTSLIDAMFHLNRPLSLFALFVGLLLAQKRYERDAQPPTIP